VDEVEVVQESNACEQLLRKLLNVRAWEGYEAVGLEEVEDTLSVEVGDDAYVVPVIEAILQMYASVDVVLVVGR